MTAVTILEQILTQAIELEASDIHIEPIINGLRVRFRVDGILYNKAVIEQELSSEVISRVKILAHMNVAERRLPQDGKFSFNYNNISVDLRVSTFPAVNGEKVVIRLLDKSNKQLDIYSLGFESILIDQIKKLAKSSSGFFLVTGPTGSGKTTTLHAMLNLVNSEEKNISTLEDPVEYHISGITQGNIYSEVGFTFETGIKALLRQDPDIIMVGEIRDKKTAQIAIAAALTGHLVLSTLHTNNAIGTLMRLLDMKIEPFLLNSALTGILSQRLVRKLCNYCKFQKNISEQEYNFINNLKLPIQVIYDSHGCDYCNNMGYKGRTGIFELLVISDKLRTLITKSPIFQDLSDQAYSDGMIPISIDSANKVNTGITTLYEIARVLI